MKENIINNYERSAVIGRHEVVFGFVLHCGGQRRYEPLCCTIVYQASSGEKLTCCMF